MTRIAIAADLHVDDFGTRVDASGWNSRFEDGIAAIEFITDSAIDANVDALVVAGDYTEHRAPSPPRVSRIVDALRTGPSRQVHVRGNHDQERSGRSIVDILGAVDHYEGHTRPGISVVGDVAICAIPFLGPSYLRSQPGFEAAAVSDVYAALGEAYLTIARGLYADAHDRARTRILVGHQQLAGGRMNDSQAAFLGGNDLVVDSRALAAIGFDAVIFGHVHRGQTVVDDPACPVMFVGSSHRVDFAEELEDKRFLVVENAGEQLSIESVSIPARRFVTLTGADLESGIPAGQVDGAVVRVRDLDPLWDAAALRRELDEAGAFDVQEIRQRRPEASGAAGGLSESLTAPEALEQYFDGDPDREALVKRGRWILEEAVA